MVRMTLREAAERTSRSITTLRRYIRKGRLQADKRDGRFGPEYFVSEQNLHDAGLPTRPASGSLPVRAPGGALSRRRYDNESVPLPLYQDLQLKHEQLLVQYGMVRAGGLRAIGLQAELEQAKEQVLEARQALEQAEQHRLETTKGLRKDLRGARLELEGRAIEIAALREKVRALEMLTRNAETSETIERQFKDVMEQKQRVEKLSAPADPAWPRPARPRDH